MRIFQIFMTALFLSSCQAFQPQSNSSTQKENTPQSKNADNKAAKYQPTVNRDPAETLIPRGLELSKPPKKIAFGSCLKQNSPAPLLRVIAESKPDLMLYIGDNVYASKPELQPISEAYRKLKSIPEYRELRENVPSMAIWDDHDYGLNDGGANNPLKEEAKKEFLKEFSYVKDSLSSHQQGIYHSKILGDKKHQVQIIMLDTRWYRSDLTKAPNWAPDQRFYSPSTNIKDTLLGAEQWRWFEQEIKKPASLKIIVSSIQVIGETPTFEKWGNFPHEKRRLYETIKNSGYHNIVLISGDRHIGIVSQEKIKSYGTIFEITSSSLNSPADRNETDPSYVEPVYNKVNYGMIDINWSAKRAQIALYGGDGRITSPVVIKLH